jgi:hypothetical protein
MVMPRQHVMQKKGTQKCLGFFLQCCPDAYSEYVFVFKFNEIIFFLHLIPMFSVHGRVKHRPNCD